MRARRARAGARRGSRDPRRGASSALDAVEAAVRVLEEDPCFNAGRGSVLTASGCIELDAAIMDGRTRAAGAVAGLRTTRAPISLARQLLEQGPHVFLSGKGADEFARERGLEQVAQQLVRDSRAPAPARGAARRRRVRRRDQIWHGRRGCGRRRRPCRGRDLDRRADRQALGPGRRFAADRRRHVRRRPLGGRLGDRLRRIFHPRRRRASARRARADRRRVAAGRARCECSPTSQRSAARAGLSPSRPTAKRRGASPLRPCTAAWPMRAGGRSRLYSEEEER